MRLPGRERPAPAPMERDVCRNRGHDNACAEHHLDDEYARVRKARGSPHAKRGTRASHVYGGKDLNILSHMLVPPSRNEAGRMPEELFPLMLADRLLAVDSLARSL